MSADVDLLASQLKSSEPAARASAAEQLGRLGEAAQPAAAALVCACGDESEEVRQWASSALEELGSPRADDVGALAELLKHENADVAYWAATLLGRLAKQADSAVVALAELLGSSRANSARQRAAWALGEIGSPASAALPALESAAAGNDPRLARLATRAIGQIKSAR